MLNINSKINFTRFFSGLIVVLGLILLVLAISAKMASQSKPAEIISTPLSSATSSPVVSAGIIKDNGISYIIYAGSGKKIYDGAFLLEESPLSNLNVFTVLKELADKNKFDIKYNYNYPKLGVLIDSIAGVKSGTDNKWWQYWVNDKLGEVAADKQELKAGDKVEWRFEKANF